MPWNNQGGGGPWRPNQGPWGSGPSPSGPRPPNFDDFVRGSQERLRRFLPGGGAGSLGLIVLAVAIVAIWAFTGIFTVQTGEVGVVQRFGAFVRQEPPGLHYHWPYPIETVKTPDVALNRRTDVGLRVADSESRRTVGMREVPEESLMLTGDENIVDINFSVFWVISDAPKYLFNVQDPEGTIKAIAESAMREVIGRNELQPILTQGRQKIEAAVQDLMQTALDSYGAGVQITQVQLQKVDPPAEVIAAFRDVQAARADQERIQNEAGTYANRVVPDARGRAARIGQDAEAYRSRSVAEARGQANRFDEVYKSYKAAPDVTRERMFLETMERVYADTPKIILDTTGGGPVTYLPLGDLFPKSGPSRPSPARTQPSASAPSSGADQNQPPADGGSGAGQ